MERKLISIITPCYNEASNIGAIYQEIASVMSDLPNYGYEHIFIDNASKDETVAILRVLTRTDDRVKLILNTRNFGHIRSPYYALLQCKGDAAVIIAADLQDPPLLIRDFIREWEKGFKIVVGIKLKNEGNRLGNIIRNWYYKVLNKLSDTPLLDNYMGFGLFDRRVVDILRDLDDPYPYLRGLIADIGFATAEIPYVKPKRKSGKTKNNWNVLFDVAMLGLTNNTKVPLRLAIMCGLFIAAMSFVMGLAYFAYKLVYWEEFSVGIAPLIIGVFFFGGVQLLFLGILGEYIGAIYTQVLHRPLVIEKERVNFD